MLIGACTPVLGAGDVQNILVNETGVVYTKAFKTSLAQNFGIAAKATSVLGTAGVKIELQQSPIFTASLDGAADTNFVEPDGMNDIMDIADENMHVKTVTPVPMAWSRYKLTGSGSNPADTLVNIWNFMQEPT
jgi:hypothetical protein